MSSGHFTGGSPDMTREIGGAEILKDDRLFAPVEQPAPIEEADLERYASKIMPRVSKTMRRLTRGASEARTHAPLRFTEEDPQQSKVRMRQDRTRLRHLKLHSTWRKRSGR